MELRTFAVGGLALGACLSATGCEQAPPDSVAATPWDPTPPLLHHAHLNTVDAQRAIDGYLRLWPAGERGNVAGFPAFVSDMSVLFTEVQSPPSGAWDAELQRSHPQSPFWHIGAFVNTTGVFETLEQAGVEVLKLKVGPDDQSGVYRSGLTPYSGIKTGTQLDTVSSADPREGGFGYVVGPDGALVELTGGARTTASFSHVHLFHEEPLCAANWYVTNLGMTLPPRRNPETGDTISAEPHTECAEAERGEAGWPSLENAGTVRGPRGTVRHGNGSLSFYPRQCDLARCGDDEPLVPSRGQVLDHIGFTVDGLDKWLAHVEANGVRVSEGPYPFGDTRAAMIEGPDGLSIELIEGTGLPPASP